MPGCRQAFVFHESPCGHDQPPQRARARRRNAAAEVHTVPNPPPTTGRRPDYPLARERRVTSHQWSKCDFISVGRNSGKRRLMEQALLGVTERPPCVFETQHLTTVLGLVEAGLNVTVVPALAMAAAIRPLLFSLPLIEPAVTRRIGLIRRRRRTLTPAAQPPYDRFDDVKTTRARS